MNNPVAQYMADTDTGTVKFSVLTGLSKGYVSAIKHGEKPITPRVAKALAKLTGRPWWEYLPEEEAAA